MPANGNRPLKLQFGLINHEGRYLTAENFGFKVITQCSTKRYYLLLTLQYYSTSSTLNLTLFKYHNRVPVSLSWVIESLSGECVSSQPEEEADMDSGAGLSGLSGSLPPQPPGPLPGF